MQLRRRASRAFLLASLASLLAHDAAPGAERPPTPDVLLVTLDTVRADRLGSYGWPHARTPNLDALARRGVRFERCDTAVPVTLPSHATLLTGLLPPRHGVRDNGTFALGPEWTTLAERFRSAGYDTGAVISAVVLARRHGLDQGFRIYDDDLGAGYTAATQVSERSAEAATDAALALLAKLERPFFLWVHYFDPHEEYRPPTRFADLGGPSRLYDGEIAFVDEQLGRLLAALPPETLVAAVGDHGEMLGEHGERTHGLLPFAGARRVPLIVAGAGVPRGVVDRCLARTVDLPPTLLALAGLATPPDLDGEPLLPLPAAHEPRCARTSYSESFLPFFAYRWYPLRALSDGDWLYLQAPTPALYDLRRAGGEAAGEITGKPAVVARLRSGLASLLAAAGEELEPEVGAGSPLDAEQRAQLLALGYVGGAAGGTVSAALPDPRAMTDVAEALHRIHRAVQEGRCRESLRELQTIVRRDPRNFPALNLAGFCLKEAGRPADALALFQRASAVNDLSALPVANAAGALLALGRRQEAAREYRRALALDPAQAESAANLARLLREGGDRPGALAVLEAAWEAGCREPSVLLERGVARAETGDLRGALADFREAARRDPANPVPLENAARASFQLGQVRAAAQLYEQLLRLVPSRGDLWKSLGAIRLESLGEPAGAREAFRRALALESDPRERRRLEEILATLPE